MRKTLLKLSVILLAMFVLLTFLDWKGIYRLEKRIWHLNQQLSNIAKDPKTSPDSKFNKLAADYQKITQDFPESPLAPIALIHAGRVYLINQNYTKADELFQRAINEYPENKQALLIAFSESVKVYIAQKDSSKVVALYKRMQTEFPLSLIGIQAPLSISYYWLNLKESEKAQAATLDAITYYQKTLETQDNRNVQFQVLNLLARAYSLNQQWSLSAKTFGRILLEFPETQYLNLERANILLKTLNKISVLQLKDVDSPIKLYQTFINTYANHPLNPVLTQMIEALQNIKEDIKTKTF